MNSLYIFFIIVIFLLCPPRGNSKENNNVGFRFASAALASDEIMYDILKESGNLNKLVGVSYLADSKKYSNINGLVKFIPYRLGQNIESIINASVSHIVLSKFNRVGFINQVRKINIKTLLVDKFNSIADIVKNYELIGEFIGEIPSSQKLIASFKKEISMSNKKISINKSAMIVLKDGSVIGGGSVPHEIIVAAGLNNITSKYNLKGWGRISEEIFHAIAPDYYITTEDGSVLLTQKKIEKNRIIVVKSTYLFAASFQIKKAINIIATRVR
jgi:ABC-type Fe3+-hydroxamate transport system substrate-binding protein